MLVFVEKEPSGQLVEVHIAVVLNLILVPECAPFLRCQNNAALSRLQHGSIVALYSVGAYFADVALALYLLEEGGTDLLVLGFWGHGASLI